MDSILSYLLSTQKKARFIIFSQNGKIVARQNKIGTISSFTSQLPNVYSQQDFPNNIVVLDKKYSKKNDKTEKAVERNVVLYVNSDDKKKQAVLALLFAEEYNAYIATGFVESSVQFNYFEAQQQIRQEFEVRNGFNIGGGNVNMNLDFENNVFNQIQDITLYGLKLQFIQKLATQQKQQFPVVCFLDSENPDFEFLIQKILSMQLRMPFCYFVTVIKNVIVYPAKSKKIDSLAETKAQFRQISQKSKFVQNLNVVSDYPGLLEEVLQNLPFCYQLFNLQNERFKEELGCVVDKLEDEVRQLILDNEMAMEKEHLYRKQQYLVKVGFEQMTDINLKQQIIRDIEKDYNEKVKIRKNYYYIQKYCQLDRDIIIQKGKVIFGGIELTLMRQAQKLDSNQLIVLAFGTQSNIPQLCEDLEKLQDEYFVILLIQNIWQFNLRKLQDAHPQLQNFNLLADEFQIFQKISQTCNMTQSFIKYRGGRIQKVVALATELEDTDEEMQKIQELEQQIQEDEKEEKQLAKIKMIFETYDINGDGVISKEEAMNQLLNDNLPEKIDLEQEQEKICQIMDLIDFNQNGVMELDEFTNFARCCGIEVK